jgi:hypothetical protein
MEKFEIFENKKVWMLFQMALRYLFGPFQSSKIQNKLVVAAI